MKVIEISRPGDPHVLQTAQRETPKPRPGEVLIRVAAAGVNRPDLMQRLGKYPPPPGASDIPGLEVAGTITEIGAANEDASRWNVGDRVCALVAGGGYAEYCLAPAPQCLPIPAGLDMVTAAAIPETYFTVWTNFFERGNLQRAERALVHGGTSGIGTTAVQLGRAFGASVIATAGSDDKCEACRRIGAEHAINYRTTDFVEAVLEFTSGGGVDVVLDIIGGEYLQKNIDCLAMHGRLVQIGLQGGAKAQLNLAVVMQRRLTITGSTLRPANRPGEGCDRPRARGARLAAVVVGESRARDLPDVAVGASGRGTSAARIGRSRREGGAGHRNGVKGCATRGAGARARGGRSTGPGSA